MTEWRKIEGYDNYSISEDGKIRNDRNGYIRKNTINNTGYYVVSFKVDGKSKIELVHRLLALAFIDREDSNRDCVNHIDGNKLNNGLDNLEWVTKAENNAHAYKKGLMNTEKAVMSEDVSSGEKILYPSAREAFRQTGICHRQISDACLGRQKTAHGKKWKFI